MTIAEVVPDQDVAAQVSYKKQEWKQEQLWQAEQLNLQGLLPYNSDTPDNYKSKAHTTSVDDDCCCQQVSKDIKIQGFGLYLEV